jgi:hypothetical protein
MLAARRCSAARMREHRLARAHRVPHALLSAFSGGVRWTKHTQPLSVFRFCMRLFCGAHTSNNALKNAAS